MALFITTTNSLFLNFNSLSTAFHVYTYNRLTNTYMHTSLLKNNENLKAL